MEFYQDRAVFCNLCKKMSVLLILFLIKIILFIEVENSLSVFKCRHKNINSSEDTIGVTIVCSFTVNISYFIKLIVFVIHAEMFFDFYSYSNTKSLFLIKIIFDKTSALFDCYCYYYLGTFKAYLCQYVVRPDLLSSMNTIYPSHLLSIRVKWPL